MKRKFLCVVLFFIMLFTVSCNTVKAEGTLLRTPAETKMKYEKLSDDFKEFLLKLNTFSASLTDAVYTGVDESGNMAISPLSLYMTLAMAAECAEAETRSQILNALGLEYDGLLAYTQKLYEISFKKYEADLYNGKTKLTALEQLSNSIWIDQSISLNDACLDTLSESLYVYPYHVDFANKTAGANRKIREFIKEKTNGLIDSDFGLSSQTLIALINTLYLKEIWNTDGEELSLTDKQYSFENADTTETKKKLLQGDYILGKTAEADTFTYFYTTTEHNFRLKFIVPKEGYSLNEVFTRENIETVNRNTDYGGTDEKNRIQYYTRCLFPEFSASYDEDIKDILINDFQITDLFDSQRCDFSNLCGQNVFCDKVIHKTKLEVNRKGIEGAAVTVMDMAESAAPEEYTKIYADFIVDRAFGYILTDSNGIPLFSGVVQRI